MHNFEQFLKTNGIENWIKFKKGDQKKVINISCSCNLLSWNGNISTDFELKNDLDKKICDPFEWPSSQWAQLGIFDQWPKLCMGLNLQSGFHEV